MPRDLFSLCAKKPLLYKHPLKQSLHRRQGGDDDAENGIHADGEEIVDERVDPGVGKAILQAHILKEDCAGNRARDHTQTSRDGRANGQIFREERRCAEQRKRHEIIQNELHGVHDIRPLHHLQKRKRERGGIAVKRTEIGGIGKDGQHGEQRYRSAERQGKELEVTQHKRKRDGERAVHQRLRAAGF